jgi:uncharacterized protein (DUF1800 family)
MSELNTSPAVLIATAGAAALALNACGGGAGTPSTGSGSGGGTTTPPVAVPPTTPKPTAAQSSRLLAQSLFGATDTDLTAVQTQGYSAWLDAQFALPASQTGWDWLMANGYNDATFITQTLPMDYMIWKQLMGTSDQLRKRVALALSEIMVASVVGVAVNWRSFAMAAYWDTLAANAFGNFRMLLEAITLNPAMGYYLNTLGNQKATAAGRVPDENYGREVMQLFTIGLHELNTDGTEKLGTNGLPIETYTQSDVTNIARVFTGWNVDNTGSTATNLLYIKQPMANTASLHETGASTFLGVTVPANATAAESLKIALDTLFNHANVGPFIGKQLIQRLVTSNPTTAYVGRVAAAFNNNGAGVRGDLKAVLKAVLLDDEARNDATLARTDFGRIREPMVRLVQWARTFNVTSPSDQYRIADTTAEATRLGQSPLRSPTVFNFFRPGFVPPNTALATAGQVSPELQIASEVTVAGYINYMQTVVKAGLADAIPAYTSELALVADTTALVDRLNLLLAANQLSAATLTTIRTALASIAITTDAGKLNRVAAAVWLVMTAPEYLVQK